MEDCTLFTCADFWKDVKRLSKHIKSSLLEVELTPIEYEQLSIVEKISAVPILRQISTTIKNKISKLNELPNNDKNGQQPFLSDNWILWKMRWAVDNRGSSYGLRIIYSVNGKYLVFAAIKHKKEIKDNESGFQKEVIERLRVFFDCHKKAKNNI
ncbi:MAG: hypothetical protein WC666_01255 [Candidatus Paceibacterota bacterium]|jgi:hypothetical protein